MSDWIWKPRDAVKGESEDGSGNQVFGGRQKMTLELKYQNWWDNAPAPYLVGGVKEITSQTEYGEGTHAITVVERRVFPTECFEYIRDKDTGEYYVKDGKWVGKEEAHD